MLPRHLLLLAVFYSNCAPAQEIQGGFDDSDRNALGRFNPISSWRTVESLAAKNGTYKATRDPSAMAIFQFKGVAVDFYSPIFPHSNSTGLTTTTVTMDSGPPFLIDLTYETVPGGFDPGLRPSSRLWGVRGMNNTFHTLTVSMGSGELAIVDYIEYREFNEPTETVLETYGRSATASSTPTTTASGTSILTSQLSTTTSSVPPSISPSIPASGPSTPVLPIALGISFGVLALVLIALAMFICVRRKKSLARAGTLAGPHLDPPEMTAPSTHVTSMYSDDTYPTRDSSTILTWNGPQSKEILLPPASYSMTPGSVAGGMSQFGELNVHASDHGSSSEVVRAGGSKMVISNPSSLSRNELEYSGVRGGASQAGVSFPSEGRTGPVPKSQESQLEDPALVDHVAPPAYTTQ